MIDPEPKEGNMASKCQRCGESAKVQYTVSIRDNGQYHEPRRTKATASARNHYCDGCAAKREAELQRAWQRHSDSPPKKPAAKRTRGATKAKGKVTKRRPRS